MKRLTYCLLSFLIGLPNAFAWACYVEAIQARSPAHAAFWDGCIVLLGVVGVLTVWERSERSVFVLLAGALGGMLGTYWTVGG